MAPKKTISIERQLEEAAAGKHNKAKYVLRLYVAGINPRSSAAIRRVTELCEKHLAGRYDLEVVDIYQHPEIAKNEQLIAAPTLIKELPLPLRRFIGGMFDEEKILVGLDLRPKEEPYDQNESEAKKKL